MKVEKNALEWGVFGVSLALISAVVGVLLYAHITSEHRPPSIRIVIGTPERSGDNYAVPLDVFNDGDVTAEEVEVEVVLIAEGNERRSTVVLAFVPHGSRRRAWVGFSEEPDLQRLRARVVGYREP
jgi:uncharacterized protein (TIGR02588 family)